MGLAGEGGGTSPSPVSCISPGTSFPANRRATPAAGCSRGLSPAPSRGGGQCMAIDRIAVHGGEERDLGWGVHTDGREVVSSLTLYLWGITPPPGVGVEHPPRRHLPGYLSSRHFKPDIRSKRFSTPTMHSSQNHHLVPPAPSAALLPQPAALAHDSRPSSRLSAALRSIDISTFSPIDTLTNEPPPAAIKLQVPP